MNFDNRVTIILLFVTSMLYAVDMMAYNDHRVLGVTKRSRVKRTLGHAEKCVPLKKKKCVSFLFQMKKKRVCVWVNGVDCISVD